MEHLCNGGPRNDACPAGAAIRKTPAVVDILARGFDILRADPYNRSGTYLIRTLTAKEPGFGRWRLRLGAYRLRYDIVGQDVVLYSFAHRKDAY